MANFRRAFSVRRRDGRIEDHQAGLARGSIKVFAATTAVEDRRDIEKDPDLKR